MCGIIGINSQSEVVSKTLKGLLKLEYRGYDSAGISFIGEDKKISTLKVVGKINLLQEITKKEKAQGTLTISHTRWATHGEPSEKNAHPHSSAKISIVHNGIIENSDEIKSQFSDSAFKSETDSEVILHLVEHFLNNGISPANAIRKATAQLEGSYAILAIFADHPEIMIATKKNSPLVLGQSDDSSYVSSDSYSLSGYVESVSYLEDQDLAILSKGKFEIFDINGNPATRSSSNLCRKVSSYTKGNFEHYMQKEIFEQPMTSKDTLDHYIKNKKFTEAIPKLDIEKIEKIYIIACGTSYFAGLIAKSWIENYLHISTEVEIASEFQFNPLVQNKNNISIFISQSGETADTVRCLREFKNYTQKSIGIINSTQSTIARETDISLPLCAGQEIGVASTKAFTSQLLVLACFTLKASSEKNSLPQEKVEHYINHLLLSPGKIAESLNHTEIYRNIAKDIVKSKSVMFIGRGPSYAIASEGALKLKELSYIHAESFPAGELKHGPIALIDEKVSVVALAPNDGTIHKTSSNIHSILSRKGNVILLSDSKEKSLTEKCKFHISIPYSDPFSSPILYNIPQQLISYYAAILSGNNVDQPRNLAKSVTVE
jgi:glucosamine--fructose-6-phosphate aminotransferase (isomerizing)